MIKYVAYVNLETGRVDRCSLPQYNTPSDKSVLDDGEVQAIHVREDNMPEGCESMFHLTRSWWYDIVSDKFIYVGDPPNDYAWWDKNINGWDWNRETLMNDIISYRNVLLSQSDWTQMNDSPLSDEEKSKWATYRQELRDIPEILDGPESLEDVPWPDSPE
jgi:hypothetical protein